MPISFFCRSSLFLALFCSLSVFPSRETTRRTSRSIISKSGAHFAASVSSLPAMTHSTGPHLGSQLALATHHQPAVLSVHCRTNPRLWSEALSVLGLACELGSHCTKLFSSWLYEAGVKRPRSVIAIFSCATKISLVSVGLISETFWCMPSLLPASDFLTPVRVTCFPLPTSRFLQAQPHCCRNRWLPSR